MFKVILIYAGLRVICRLIDRKADKEVYDFNNSEEETSFNDMRKVKGKLRSLDSLHRILSFTSNAFLIMSILVAFILAMAS